MIRRFSRLVWLLLPLLAACNLNILTDTSSQVITGPPQVQMVSPLPNATYLEGVAVNIQALVTNAGPDIDRVEIVVDDTMVASLAQPNTAGVAAFSVTESWSAAGAGTHTISVAAMRSDGLSSDPAIISISVVSQVTQPQNQSQQAGGDNNSPASQPTSDNTPTGNSQPQPTDIPEPSNTPQPTATATPSGPMATFLTGVNVRRGPDTLFVPPVGSIAANDTTAVLAVNPENTWYKIKYYNGSGWVLGTLMSIEGDLSNLPVEVGPPLPTPTFTPVPPTPTPPIEVNLVAGAIRTEPSTIACGETINIFVEIANFGTKQSPGGSIKVIDEANGLKAETSGVFGEIDPGQTRGFGPIPLTVDTNHSVEHVLRLIVDPGNQVRETNEDDNRSSKTYTLAKGTC